MKRSEMLRRRHLTRESVIELELCNPCECFKQPVVLTTVILIVRLSPSTDFFITQKKRLVPYSAFT